MMIMMMEVMDARENGVHEGDTLRKKEYLPPAQRPMKIVCCSLSNYLAAATKCAKYFDRKQLTSHKQNVPQSVVN